MAANPITDVARAVARLEVWLDHMGKIMDTELRADVLAVLADHRRLLDEQRTLVLQQRELLAEQKADALAVLRVGDARRGRRRRGFREYKAAIEDLLERFASRTDRLRDEAEGDR